MGMHFDRGQRLFDLGRYREAIEEYLLEVAEQPDFAAAHANIAAAQYNLGDIPAAQASLDAALSIDPELAHAYHVLSYVHQSQGNFFAARDAVLESLRLEKSADNYFRLAQIHTWNEDRDRTLEATASALQVDPEHVPSILLRGKKLIELGQHEQARELFTSALSLSPEVAEAHHALGKLRLSHGEADEAMSLLTEARRLDPLRVNDRRAIAEAYGLNLPLFRFVNRYAVRWHLWPFLRKWQFALVLTVVFCTASLVVSTHGARRLEINPVTIGWWLFCVLLTNYLVLPYTLPHLARGAAMLRAKRQLDVGWFRVGFELISWVKALLLIGLATFLGTGFSGVPELFAMIFAVSTCFPLVAASVRAKGKRSWLGTLICLPLCFVLSFFAVVGISLLAYADPSQPESTLAWPFILGFFAITFFSDKIASLLCRPSRAEANSTP